MECAGVEDHQSSNPFGMFGGVRHADHPAPIVDDQCQVPGSTAVIEPFAQVGHSTSQRIFVTVVARLIGQSAADVIGDQAAIPVSQTFYEVSVVVRPVRIAMQHDDGVALPFIEIMHPQAVDLGEM